jgi:SHS2 domain-containing protein
MDPKIRSEIIKRLSDKEWRMGNLYFIKDKEGRKVKFKANYAQTRFRKEKHGLDIILKARQQGFTTESCISFLDDCLFNSNLSAGIIAHNLEDANSFFNDKIKFAYDNLPEDLKAAVRANTERAGELRFSNGSSIRVRTSFRSGTLQRLHISEFGKICAKSPDKAKEIVTGALNAIATGLHVVIESTAEGKVGYFFDYCEAARSKERRGEPLTAMDFKFHFYAWWESSEYQLDPTGIVIPQRLEDYFKELEKDHGIKLTPAQRAWYYKKEELMGDDMGREFPSHPDEAFAQSVEGAYFAKEIAWLESQKPTRIGTVPWEPALKVHTVWDLGMNDSTSIWFFQDGPEGRRFIDYMEASGENLPWYAARLRERPFAYGKTILPHDARVRSLETGNTREDTLRTLGFSDIIIIPQMDPMTRIQAARVMLLKCWFDQAKCGDGLEALRQYRKAWDEKAGCWKSSPLHDWTSHAADSFGMSAFADCKEVFIPRQTKAANRYR